MFALSARDVVNLRAPRVECACIFAAHSEEDKFRNVSKVKSYATTIRSAVFPDFVPNDVAFVVETPRFHYFKAFRKQCIGHPHIQVAHRSSCMCDWEFLNLREGQCAVSG